MNPGTFHEENPCCAEEAERLPCSARAIICCLTIIGELTAWIVEPHAVGEVMPTEVLFDLLSTLAAQTTARLVREYELAERRPVH